LGNATTTSSSSPVVVSGLNSGTTAVSITAGGDDTCALLANGRAECWGDNAYGQLGNGTHTASSTPVMVFGLTNAVAITAGGDHSCALLSNGTAKCWGDNFYGELGNGTTTNSSIPVVVSGLTNAVAITAGAGGHSCALLASGTVMCWGNNEYGELGTGSGAGGFSSTPLVVGSRTDAVLTNVVAIRAGAYHSCASLANGTAKCWGDNEYGQLGNGTFSQLSFVPVVVTGLTSVAAITAGAWHTCASLANGTAKCWGENVFGELGNGRTGPQMCGSFACSTTPVVVSGLTSVAVLTAGGGHSCAVLTNGAAECWGLNNYGQLGNGKFTNSLTPVVVWALTNAASITAGGSHSCVLLANGTAKCWGLNKHGQLGDGTIINRSIPVNVTGL
jgi:alpha-tubulin suppressor-like RCC1 family protein